MRHLPLLFFFVLLPLLLLVVWGEDQAIGNETGWPVGQPVPTVALTVYTDNDMGNAAPALPLHTLKGQPYLLNIFASWCAPCAAEQPVLEEISKKHQLPIVGIAWKTKPEKLKLFLNTHGNPFRQILLDTESKAMLSLGGVGVPESYLVDAEGIIRHHVTGSLSLKDFEEKMLPKLSTSYKKPEGQAK